MFYLKVHEFQGERLVAICDKDIMGKKFKHNNVSLHIQARFYGELECSLDEVLFELNRATQFNVMGKHICEALIDHKMIHPASVLWIEDNGDKVGHAILVR